LTGLRSLCAAYAAHKDLKPVKIKDWDVGGFKCLVSKAVLSSEKFYPYTKPLLAQFVFQSAEGSSYLSMAGKWTGEQIEEGKERQIPADLDNALLNMDTVQTCGAVPEYADYPGFGQTATNPFTQPEQPFPSNPFAPGGQPLALGDWIGKEAGLPNPQDAVQATYDLIKSDLRCTVKRRDGGLPGSLLIRPPGYTVEEEEARSKYCEDKVYQFTTEAQYLADEMSWLADWYDARQGQLE